MHTNIQFVHAIRWLMTLHDILLENVYSEQLINCKYFTKNNNNERGIEKYSRIFRC